MGIMGKKIKIVFTDFWSGFQPEYDFITPILKRRYEVEINTKTPDIVFCSSMHRWRQTSQYPNHPKIMYTGENHRPQHYKVDYSMSFDKHSDTNYYLPLWQLECLQHPEFFGYLQTRTRHEFKHKNLFCSYVVSNPNVKERNDIFKELSKYGEVYSYGKNFHNTDGMPPKGHDNKLHFLRGNPHKFAVTYESGIYPGYCTEKILHSFIVGSIPIYKGDPTIEEQFNSEAFVNGNGIPEKDIAKYVNYLDKNHIEFNRKYNAEIMTAEQRKKMIENINGLSDWLLNVVKGLL